MSVGRNVRGASCRGASCRGASFRGASCREASCREASCLGASGPGTVKFFASIPRPFHPHRVHSSVVVMEKDF
jgi:hypothetical protein